MPVRVILFLYIPLAEFILGENDKLENAIIVASYNSMQELVADGWVLDKKINIVMIEKRNCGLIWNI